MGTRSRGGRLRRWALAGVPWWDLALALVLVVAGLLVPTPAGSPVAHPWSELAASVAVGAVALRTRAPEAMVLLACVGALGYALVPTPTTSLSLFVAMLVIAFSVGVRLDTRRALVAAAFLLLSGYVLQVRSAAGDASSGWAEVLVTPLVLVGAPLLAGMALRRSRRQATELRRLGAALTAQQEAYAAAAALAERNRIAGELHDIVAHSVTVMVVQAGAVEQALTPDCPVRPQVRVIRQTGRQALAELRRLLGVLRVDGEPVTDDSAPMPGLADLPRLVETSGAALTVDESLPDLPTGMALTVYRVVQEGLTNATRHAAGAQVTVRVRRRHSAVEIEITDTGGARLGPVGAGRGLAGMRERIALYGGTFEAGPDVQGWRVRVTMPFAESALLP